MKKIKKKLTASWEIISMAKWLESIDRNPTNDELCEWYGGDFFPMYLTKQVGKDQIWSMTINTKCTNDEGVICNHEMSFDFDKPMSMHEVLNGSSNIKIEKDGFKTRWAGVTKNWLKELDEDLNNEWLAVEANVVATCVVEMSAKSIMSNKFASLIARI